MNKYFKNPYDGITAPVSTISLSQYRHVSTGGNTYRRETPKPVPKKQIRSFVEGTIRVCNQTLSIYPKGYDYNVLNKYSRRKFRRMSAAIQASAAQYKD